MAEYVFAVRNCRAKNSTKAAGNELRAASPKSTQYVCYSGTWGTKAKKEVVAELMKVAKLKDLGNKLEKAVAAAAAAKGDIEPTSASYSERVGKAVIQIGMGYDKEDLAAAKSGIVWLNLE